MNLYCETFIYSNRFLKILDLMNKKMRMKVSLKCHFAAFN